MEQLVARRAHNPKVAGSSPAPATTSESKQSQLYVKLAFLMPSVTICPLQSGSFYFLLARHGGPKEGSVYILAIEVEKN